MCFFLLKKLQTCRNSIYFRLLYRIAVIQTEQSNTRPFRENLSIRRKIFTKFGIDYYLKQRYNFRGNCSHWTTVLWYIAAKKLADKNIDKNWFIPIFAIWCTEVNVFSCCKLFLDFFVLTKANIQKPQININGYLRASVYHYSTLLIFKLY